VIDVSLPPWLITIFVFALGAVVGSFLNVCIYRIPQKEGLLESLRGLYDPPSTCPRCRTRIRWHDNIPIFGWLFLRGRCRTCKMRISVRYPAIELLNALLWVLVYRLEIPLTDYGFSELTWSCLYAPTGPQTIPGLDGGLYPISPTVFVHLRFLFHMVLIEALLVASFIDFDLRIIPDGSTVPAMIFGFLAAVGIGRMNLVPVYSQNPHLLSDFAIFAPQWLHPLLKSTTAVPAWCSRFPHLHGLAVAVAGFLVGGGIVWLVRILGQWVLRRESMGFGDVILMAMVGTFLGWQPVVAAFFIAPVCALVTVICTAFARRDQYIPYGPYLSLGTLVTILTWRWIWGAFQRMFELGPLLVPLVLFMVVFMSLLLVAMQGLKWLFGFEVYPEEPVAVWTAADQNHYQAGENVDRTAGRWRTSREWPGTAAARGTLHVDRWRGR
jgi:leader peptidase (prepilin peptidase)/N-methyltransferase